MTQYSGWVLELDITESQEEEWDNGVDYPEDCQEYRGVLDSLVKIKTAQELCQLGNIRDPV